MELTEKTSKILSPVMVWKDFDDTLPLKESKVGEDVIDNIVYSKIYFYGRETGGGRVRIFGLYAKSKAAKKSPKAGLLILPDIGKTVDFSLVNAYVDQGYAVLMIDYCGACDGLDYYTKYPECVSYANYISAGRAIDHCDQTAKETAWYEWVAVARYAVSFLRNQPELNKIGVIGIKEGANVGWQLCGTDKRIDCFVPLFGAGWRSYKGAYKFAESDAAVNDERLRYIAGVEAHSYAQYVTCPVFYMTSTNSADFDIDRAMDTLTHLPAAYPWAVNCSVGLDEYLDANCKRNIDVFLAKCLYGYKAVLPKTPRLTINCEDKYVTVKAEIDFSDLLRPKKFTVYLAEDGENPRFRAWNEMRMQKSDIENVKTFDRTILGNSAFVLALAVVEYKNGFTVSSLMTVKKINRINARRLNLLYSGNDKTEGFNALISDKSVLLGLFADNDNAVEYVEGSNKIFGVTAKYGLISYKFNKRAVDLSERSMLVLDVNAKEYCVLKLTLLTDGGAKESYTFSTAVYGGDVWQNVLVKCSDFKSKTGMSVKDYSAVVALTLESNSKCIFNNLLVV